MTKLDRCDRCGAEAMHKFALDSNGDLVLLFCNHHATEHMPSLFAQGWVAVDAKELISA